MSQQPSIKALKILESLQEAVTQELEKKRRLGHYAVFWKNGKAVCVGEDAPPEHTSKDDDR